LERKAELRTKNRDRREYYGRHGHIYRARKKVKGGLEKQSGYSALNIGRKRVYNVQVLAVDFSARVRYHGDKPIGE
jgi:hypothetical protein